jgi:hypothetical protein
MRGMAVGVRLILSTCPVLKKHLTFEKLNFYIQPFLLCRYVEPVYIFFIYFSLLLFWTAALAERSGLQNRPLAISPWRFRRSCDAVKIVEWCTDLFFSNSQQQCHKQHHCNVCMYTFQNTLDPGGDSNPRSKKVSHRHRNRCYKQTWGF